MLTYGRRVSGALPPGYLNPCEQTIKLAEEKVKPWLAQYMFGGKNPAQAEAIAKWLASLDEHQTHGRPIGIELAQQKALNVKALEDDQGLQEAVLSLFHARVLHAASDFRGGSAADAADRRPAPRAPVLRGAAARQTARAGRIRGRSIGRLQVKTSMRRMGIEAPYRRPSTSIPARDAKIYPYCSRVWRSRGQIR